jgi:hypothetical protein
MLALMAELLQVGLVLFCLGFIGLIVGAGMEEALTKRGIDLAMYVAYLRRREHRALIGVQLRLASLRYLAGRIGRAEHALAAKAEDSETAEEAWQGRPRAAGPGS